MSKSIPPWKEPEPNKILEEKRILHDTGRVHEQFKKETGLATLRPPVDEDAGRSLEAKDLIPPLLCLLAVLIVWLLQP